MVNAGESATIAGWVHGMKWQAGVAGGVTVAFRPSGSSMVPLIRSWQQVVVAPVDASKLQVGDTKSLDLARKRLGDDAALHLADLGSPLPVPDAAFDDVVASRRPWS